MGHADKLAGAGPQHRAVDYRHPFQRPPFRKASGKDVIKLVTARLYRHCQLVQVTAIKGLDPERLANVLAVMLQEHRQEFSH